MLSKLTTETHSSDGSVADLRTGGRWFDLQLDQYSFRGLMKVIATRFIPLSLLSVASTMFMWKKQPVDWKEYCAEFWLKELQESRDRFTDRRDITEIPLKNGVKHHTINQSILTYRNNYVLCAILKDRKITTFKGVKREINLI